MVLGYPGLLRGWRGRLFLKEPLRCIYRVIVVVWVNGTFGAIP
jgi:hypothetical protein